MEIARVKNSALYCLSGLVFFVCIASEADPGTQEIQNALDKAAYEGQVDTVRKLADEYPSLDLDESLIQALNGKHDDVAQFLLQRGADPNGGLRPGRHIYSAARNHNKPMLDSLIALGASVDAEADNDTSLISTPLTHAVFDGDMAAVRLLLDAGANVNQVSAGGNTALLQAIRHDGKDKQELIRLLMEHGADPDLEGAAGISPRLAAEASGLNEVLSLIDEYRPKPKPQNLPEPVFNYTLDNLTSGDVIPLLHGKVDKLYRSTPDEGFYLISMASEPERIACHGMKEYTSAVPYSDANFLVGVCGHGPFDANNINTTIKLSGVFLKSMYKADKASEEQRRFFESMVARERTISNTEDSYSFVMMAVGEGGIAFFPTGVIIDKETGTSLVVQFLNQKPDYMDTAYVESFTRSLYRMARPGVHP
jgi:ankyrin repeat protein